MIQRRRFLQITAAMALTPALVPARGRAETRWQGTALGADAEVTLTGDARAAEAVLRRLPAVLQGIEAEFSLFRPDSALVQLNNTGRLVAPSPRFLELCALCDRVHRATGGVFDPTVQPLWRALAQGGDLATARAALGWGRVGISRAGVTLDAGQALTFNGIAQGFATDAVRALLADAGFTQALIGIGEYAALGGPWRIGVEDPAAGLLATRSLTGGAMATSSPGAMTLAGGQAHILHPQGRAPVWSSVTVLADSAALADGLSTAWVFAGVDEITTARRRLVGVGEVVLVDANGNLRRI